MLTHLSFGLCPAEEEHTSSGAAPTAALRTRLLQLHPALAKQMAMQRPESRSLGGGELRDPRPALVSDGAVALAQLRQLQTAGRELVTATQVRLEDSLQPCLVEHVADNVVALSTVANILCKGLCEQTMHATRT